MATHSAWIGWDPKLPTPRLPAIGFQQPARPQERPGATQRPTSLIFNGWWLTPPRSGAREWLSRNKGFPVKYSKKPRDSPPKKTKNDLLEKNVTLRACFGAQKSQTAAWPIVLGSQPNQRLWGEGSRIKLPARWIWAPPTAANQPLFSPPEFGSKVFLVQLSGWSAPLFEWCWTINSTEKPYQFQASPLETWKIVQVFTVLEKYMA